MKRNIFFGFVLLLSVLAKAQPITNGLVGYWPFNGNANDESINTNDGVVYGATLTDDRFGNLNSAYHFDGINDFINVGNDPSLNMYNTSFTLTAWVRRMVYPGGFTQPIFTNRGLNTGFEFGIDGVGNGYEGKSVYVTNNSSGAYGIFRSSSLVPLSDYHFVVLVFNYVGSNNNYATLYIDNVQSGTGTNLIDVAYTTNDAFVGWEPHLIEASRFFEGDIDDIGLYNRALTELEIDTLYNNYTTGINDYAKDRLTRVYPNPSTGVINLETNSNDEKNIIVINSIGEEIVKKNTSSSKVAFDISGYPSGLYFVIINSKDKSETIKIIKE